MSRARNVVWTEGLFLTPHIFQQADRYRDELLHARLKPFTPFFYGVSELDIDRERLRNGKFYLRRCVGVMPDGLTVQIPEQDGEIKEVNFNKDSADRLGVFLAIAAKSDNGVNYSTLNGQTADQFRYQLETRMVADETALENERELQTAKKNFQILFSGQPSGGQVTLKLAELQRTPEGTVTLNTAYIPPSTALSLSPGNGVPEAAPLMEIVNFIQQRLSAKQSALFQQRRQVPGAGFSDTANFRLLHTVNSFMPLLVHFAKTPKRHPEQLYMTLVQLVGELSTFGFDSNGIDIPDYDHDNLYRTFARLKELVELLLVDIAPSKYRVIQLEPQMDPVTRRSANWSKGIIPDDPFFYNATYYLAINGRLLDSQLKDDERASRRRSPDRYDTNFLADKVKVTSPDEIFNVFSRSLPGARLHYSDPIDRDFPAAIPVKTDFRYFRVKGEGQIDHLKLLQQARSVAVHVPPQVEVIGCEVIAVEEA